MGTGTQPETVTTPTRERVDAFEAEFGCEPYRAITAHSCVKHMVIWTDAGCPVAVAAARVDLPAIAERDALRAVVEKVRALHPGHAHAPDGKTWTHSCLAGCGVWPCATLTLLPEPVE